MAMKFRAKLDDIATMRQFSGIIHTLSKISKIGVLRVCSNRLYFLVPADHNTRRISVWSVLHRNEFFKIYTMSGDADKNEILLEFSSDMLASSLNAVKGVGNVLSLKIKLTNKISPCITLELELASQGSACIHDIPVTFIPMAEWEEYQEPANENYDVGVQMPSTKTVKNIVDKLKKISNKVTITAISSGHFSLLAQTMSATIEIHFKDLVVKLAKDNGQPISASVCVDIKKMSQFLTCDSVYPSTMICYVLTSRMVHLCLSHNGFELNHYLTAIED